LKKKHWLEELVFIRAFAILAVLTIHVTMYSNMRKIDSPLYFTNYFINEFAHFAVPIFILVSGISLTISYSEKLYLKGYFIKRVTTLIPAYFFITFVYLYLFAPDTLTLSVYLDRLIHGVGTTHLYFIPLIIKLYLVFPILLWLSKKLVSIIKNIKLLFSLVIMVHLILYFRIPIMRLLELNFIERQYALNLLFFSRDFSYFWVYLGYFALGIIFALKIDEIKSFIINIRLKNVLIILPIFPIVSSIEYFNSIADYGSYGTAPLISRNSVQIVNIFFNYFAFVILFKISNLIAKKENTLTSFIQDIGNHSFAIYLLHMVFISYLVKILPYANVQYTDIIFYLLLFTFALFGSLSLSYIVNLLPIPKTVKRALVGNYVPLQSFNYVKVKKASYTKVG
jgi:peptidoglycan/LPS O-acetylase OafA/YrhL